MISYFICHLTSHHTFSICCLHWEDSSTAFHHFLDLFYIYIFFTTHHDLVTIAHCYFVHWTLQFYFYIFHFFIHISIVFLWLFIDFFQEPIHSYSALGLFSLSSFDEEEKTRGAACDATPLRGLISGGVLSSLVCVGRLRGRWRQRVSCFGG